MNTAQVNTAGTTLPPHLYATPYRYATLYITLLMMSSLRVFHAPAIFTAHVEYEHGLPPPCAVAAAAGERVLHNIAKLALI